MDIHAEFEDVGLKLPYSIGVLKDGCFRIVPVSGGTRPREYFSPQDIDRAYRRLVKKYGSNDVKIFREIEVTLQNGGKSDD